MDYFKEQSRILAKMEAYTPTNEEYRVTCEYFDEAGCKATRNKNCVGCRFYSPGSAET